MTTEELIAALYWLSEETSSLPCSECGYRDSICIPGCCMILYEAALQIETLNTFDNTQSAKLLMRNGELERQRDAALIEIELLKEAMKNEAD